MNYVKIGFEMAIGWYLAVFACGMIIYIADETIEHRDIRRTEAVKVKRK